MTIRLQNMMLAMLLALTTLFVGMQSLSQNPASGGYQLFERTASGYQADIQLASLDNFAPSPETASECCNAPNRTGAGRYTPSQPLDGAGNPIVRTNDRGGVLVQPNGSVTCGQHACGMVLNTQGRPVAVDDIISSRPPDFANGSSQAQLQLALRDNGVGSTAFSGRSVSDLGRYTSGGRPAIATVQTGSNTYHAVVVDGVTTRGGQQVVAIRDPAGSTNGGVYYETVSSFQSRFTGYVIRINKQ